MSVIGIIGFGYVGKAAAYGFADYDLECGREPIHEVLHYDKYKPGHTLEEVLTRSEIIFVCLPTPYHEEDLRIDLSICDGMIAEICSSLAGKGKIVAIKSTVTPETTCRYARTYPDVPFAFNPEFLTEANYLQDFISADRIIIGAENDWVAQRLIDNERGPESHRCNRVQPCPHAFGRVHSSRHRRERDRVARSLVVHERLARELRLSHRPWAGPLRIEWRRKPRHRNVDGRFPGHPGRATGSGRYAAQRVIGSASPCRAREETLPGGPVLRSCQYRAPYIAIPRSPTTSPPPSAICSNTRATPSSISWDSPWASDPVSCCSSSQSGRRPTTRSIPTPTGYIKSFDRHA